MDERLFSKKKRENLYFKRCKCVLIICILDGIYILYNIGRIFMYISATQKSDTSAHFSFFLMNQIIIIIQFTIPRLGNGKNFDNLSYH